MKVSAVFTSSFTAGVILLAPLLVTLSLLRLLVGWSLQFVNPVVEGTRLTQDAGNIEVVAQVVAVVLIVAAIALLGYLAQCSVGRQTFGNPGRVVNLVLLVSTVYGSVRQDANSIVERDTAHESVVLVEYPLRASTPSGWSPARARRASRRSSARRCSTSSSRTARTRPAGGSSSCPSRRSARST